MHSVQRNLLRSEVVKKYPVKVPRFSFALVWPKFAFSAATLFMLAGFILFIKEANRPSAFEMALRNPEISTFWSFAQLEPDKLADNSVEHFRSIAIAPQPAAQDSLDLKSVQLLDGIEPALTPQPKPLSKEMVESKKPELDKPLASLAAPLQNPSAEGRKKQNEPTGPAPTAELNPVDPLQESVARDKLERSSAMRQTQLTASAATRNRGFGMDSPESSAKTKPSALPQITSTKDSSLNFEKKSNSQSLSYGVDLQAAVSPVSGPLAPLVEFQIKRTGSSLEVVDSDGSLYKGAVLPNALLSGRIAETESVKRDEALGMKPLSASYGEQPASYQFTVSGTNISLGKPIEFTGNYYFYMPSETPALQRETVPGDSGHKLAEIKPGPGANYGRSLGRPSSAGGGFGGVDAASSEWDLANIPVNSKTAAASNGYRFDSNFALSDSNSIARSTNRIPGSAIRIQGIMRIGTNTTTIRARKMP